MSDAREIASSEDLRVQPDAIQGHGWLIGCDARAVQILRHSANLGALFPGWTVPFIGAKLTNLLGSETAHGLRNSLARFAGPARPALLPDCVFPGCEGVFDVTACVAGEEILVEIEKAELAGDRLALDRTRAMIDRIALGMDTKRLLLSATRLVFSVLQYDRAEIVRFNADGSSELVAQQHSHDLDAPEKPPEFSELARARLRDERTRLIVDAAAAPAPILSEPGAAPLDLTSARLRAAAQDERVALRHEGFTASLSIALMIDEALWGAIVFRDRAPRNPAMDLLTSVEIFADFLALRLHLLQKQALEEG